MTEYTCDSFRFFNLFPVYFGGKGTHAQVSTTLDIYTHAFDEKKREVSAKMQGKVGV